MNVLRERLKSRPCLLGLANMYPAAGIIEGFGAGWDFVWIDGQHGQMSYDSVAAAIRAAEAMGLGTLLRVPTHDPGFLGMYADLNPDAVMVPMVNTVDQARRVVESLRFAPVGKRSYGGRRVIDQAGRNYCYEPGPLVVVQVETPESVENAGAIAALPGVDALFYGPDDMRVQLGLAMDCSMLEEPDLRAGLEETARAAGEAEIIAATVAPTPELLRTCAGLGYRMLVGGGDIVFLRAQAAARLGELRDALGQAPAPTAPASPGSLYD